jgi:integrase
MRAFMRLQGNDGVTDMSRTVQNKLTDKAIRGASRPFPKAGLSDGGNLHLLEMPNTGTLKWRVLYRLDGKTATMWLGAYPRTTGAPGVTLAEARRLRDEIEELARKGINPKVRSGVRGAPAVGNTFGKLAIDYAADIAPPAEKSRKEWLKNLADVGAVDLGACRFGDKLPGEITGEDIRTAIAPIWFERPAKATKTLTAIGSVLRAARGRGEITTPGWSNPADYRSNFSGVLKKPVRRERHHEAMAWADLPLFMAELRARPLVIGSARPEPKLALALELIILTASRANEVLQARWGEFDRETMVWTVPPVRMKGTTGLKVEHQVPLTPAMIGVLDRAGGKGPASGYVFPSYRSRKYGKFAAGAALNLLRAMRPGSLTDHGFRSTFFDWSQDVTDFSDRLSNAALAHIQRSREQTRVQRAYDRSNLCERRRPLMVAWNDHCLSLSIAANSDTPTSIAEAA